MTPSALLTAAPAVANSVTGYIVVGAIAAFTAIVAPLILAYLTARTRKSEAVELAKQRLADRTEQYRREDEVALRAKEAAAAAAVQVAEAAQKLKEAQADTVARANEVARLAAETAADNTARLEQIDAQTRRIHTLVNSDMTAARQADLDSTRGRAAVLRRLIALAESKHLPVDPADVDDLRAAEQRGAELEAILADRLQQLHTAEAETAGSPVKIIGEPDAAR